MGRIRKTLLLLVWMAVLILPSSCVSSPVSLSAAEYTITVAEETFTKNRIGVTLLYPVVENYADAEKETAVNALAYQKAQEEFSRAGLISSGEDDLYTYTALEVTITLAEADFYSLYVSGTVTSESSGEVDDFAYTINMDMANVELYTTEQMVRDYPALRTAFEKGKFTQDFGYPLLEAETSLTDLIGQYREKYGIYPDLYFREGELGVLVEVVPVLGGCAGYTIDIRDARKWMHTENSVLARLCGMQ